MSWALYIPYPVSYSFKCQRVKIYNLKTWSSCSSLCQQKYLMTVTLPTKAGKQTQAFRKHYTFGVKVQKPFGYPSLIQKNLTTKYLPFTEQFYFIESMPFLLFSPSKFKICLSICLSGGCHKSCISGGILCSELNL